LPIRYQAGTLGAARDPVVQNSKGRHRAPVYHKGERALAAAPASC
jgi:hypothetical protein